MCHSSFGGSARIATELALELARRGHRVHLFTRTTPFGNWDHSNGVVLHSSIPDHENNWDPSALYTDWPEKDYQSFLLSVLEVIAREGLDLLHFHYAVPFVFIVKEVKEKLGEKCPLLVGTLHGSDVNEYGRDPVKGPVLAKTLRNLDGLTTVSFNYACLAKEVLKLTKPPEIIPNFVSLSSYAPQNDNPENSREMEALGESKKGDVKRPRIVHISNFRPIKNIDSLARIFLGIRKRIDAELWLVGDGQEMKKINRLFKQNGAKNDVHYWGLQYDVAPILVQTDLLLMPSLSESFGLCALEAMACGVPVLATHVGGLPEVVIHGKTGFLFPVGNHSLAADLAVALLKDRVAHREMSKAAVRQARNFRKEEIVSMYEDFYDRVLHKPRVRSCLGWSSGTIPT